MTWIKANLIALDQAANALLGGWPDETLSARCYRERRYRAEAFIDWVFFTQPHHCRAAHESEIERRHLAPGDRLAPR